jgi:hypothetical protein
MMRPSKAAGGRFARNLNEWSARACGFLGLLSAACGAADEGLQTAQAERALEFAHEPCDVESGEKVDVNDDGKMDVVRVGASERATCRSVDFNFDGIVDWFVYFDDTGKERRRESDFDRDGRIDEVTTFESGIVRRKERETNNDGKIDTWDTYADGRLAKTERDSDGDGTIDEWWSYNRPDDARCAVVVSDRNSDGQPDQETAVDLCSSENTSAPKTPSPGTSASAAPSASLAAPASPTPSAPAAAAPSSAAPPGAAGAAGSAATAPSAPSSEVE